MVKSLWSLPLSRLDSPSPLPFPTGQILQSLITCVISHRTCSRMSLKSLGSPEVNSELWGCLSSAEWRKGSPLLAYWQYCSQHSPGCCCQPWPQEHIQLSVQQDPGAPLPTCSPSSRWPPTAVCTGSWGYSPQAQGFAFPLTELHEVPACWGPLEWQHSQLV